MRYAATKTLQLRGAQKLLNSSNDHRDLACSGRAIGLSRFGLLTLAGVLSVCSGMHECSSQSWVHGVNSGAIRRCSVILAE